MKASRRAFLCGSAVIVGARLSPARADVPAGDLLGRIAQARVPVRTMRGPFTQTRTIGLLAADVRSHGTMALVRPDRLRWRLEPPDDVTFWAGPDGLAYRSAHGSGTLPEADIRIAAALDDMRTLLGGDLNKLAERWSLRVLRDDASGAEIEATPRDAAFGGTRSMHFALGVDLVRPTRALLVETPHDRTIIEFGAVAINEPIDAASMKPGER
jgi:Outer membrane lipoprotein carrier protein LolA